MDRSDLDDIQGPIIGSISSSPLLKTALWSTWPRKHNAMPTDCQYNTKSCTFHQLPPSSHKPTPAQIPPSSRSSNLKSNKESSKSAVKFMHFAVRRDLSNQKCSPLFPSRVRPNGAMGFKEDEGTLSSRPSPLCSLLLFLVHFLSSPLQETTVVHGARRPCSERLQGHTLHCPRCRLRWRLQDRAVESSWQLSAGAILIYGRLARGSTSVLRLWTKSKN